jgi:GntR family transcriptional regulator
MWSHIDRSGGTPIYRQLVEQVRQAVASGVLRPGDRLPSVRELVIELAVNPNTVARAYQELEREGVIETPRGRGSYVADREPVIGEEERVRLFAEAARSGKGGRADRRIQPPARGADGWVLDQRLQEIFRICVTVRRDSAAADRGSQG